MLYISTSQTYQAWAQWTNGVFYKANNAQEWNAEIEGNPVISEGSGFFIAPAASSTTNVITFIGDVVMAQTQDIAITEGYQILSYPFSTDIALQDTAFFISGAASDNNYISCDRISVYEDGTYQTYALWTNGLWYMANNAQEWNDEILATNIIKAGQSFFYTAQQPFIWTETNKYLQALSE